MDEKKLFDAAATGDETSLLELHKKDPNLLDRISYTSPNNTPLHVATMKGHLHFVQRILNLNPLLSQEFNSHQSSPLHIASAQGDVEITKLLLEKTPPDMCLSRDRQGRNPVHVAAIKGHVKVLAELIRKAPIAAREKLDRGHTALHLCVRHAHLEALKILVQESSELVNTKNDDGDTILHMAIMGNQVEIIQYLMEIPNIDMNAKNSNHQTAIAILQQQHPPNATNSEITKILSTKLCKSHSSHTQPVKWLTKKRDAIMVVAILIATMAFQVGVSPAGGLWQEDFPQNGNGIFQHRAGESIMAHNHPKAYKSFMRSNTICFVSSLSTILLLISGLPFRRRLFMWILMMIMWLTVTSVAVTYAISVVVVTPKKDRKSLSHVIMISVVVWSSVMGILLVGNTLRLIDRWLKNRGVVVWQPQRFKSSRDVNNGNAGNGIV